MEEKKEKEIDIIKCVLEGDHDSYALLVDTYKAPIFNGAVIQMSFGAPSAIIFGFTFGIIGALTGAFLGIMMDGYQRNFLEQKGF